MTNEMILRKSLDFANEEFKILEGILIKPEDLVFEERVRMSCFYCGRYGKNWKCPPNLPDIDYKKMFNEFEAGALVYVKIPLNERNYEDVRNNSSVILHKGLLAMEKCLWTCGVGLYLSFVAGSCKLCKNGCGQQGCNNPYLSRSPLEATGVNVVESAKKYGLNIGFPPGDYMIRCGLILW